MYNSQLRFGRVIKSPRSSSRPTLINDPGRWNIVEHAQQYIMVSLYHTRTSLPSRFAYVNLHDPMRYLSAEVEQRAALSRVYSKNNEGDRHLLAARPPMGHGTSDYHVCRGSNPVEAENIYPAFANSLYLTQVLVQAVRVSLVHLIAILWQRM